MLHETTSDARRCDRIYVRMAIALLVESQGVKVMHDVFTLDLSQRGARVRAGFDLVPGQPVEVVTNEGRKVVVPSRVVWVGTAGSGREGEAGIEFIQPLPTVV